jgi:hypothetical protein
MFLNRPSVKHAESAVSPSNSPYLNLLVVSQDHCAGSERKISHPYEGGQGGVGPRDATATGIHPPVSPLRKGGRSLRNGPRTPLINSDQRNPIDRVSQACSGARGGHVDSGGPSIRVTRRNSQFTWRPQRYTHAPRPCGWRVRRRQWSRCRGRWPKRADLRFSVQPSGKPPFMLHRPTGPNLSA